MAVTETVETGAGISGANTYALAATITTYWENQPHRAEATAWAEASDETQKGAGIEASAYLDAVFGPYYMGQRAGYVQGLLFPRVNAKDEAGYPLPSLPPQIITAACELAGRAVTARLAKDATLHGAVKRQREKVGPLETETEYSGAALMEERYGYVREMLAPVLNGMQPFGMPTWSWA